jgi:plastocyanin
MIVSILAAAALAAPARAGVVTATVTDSKGPVEGAVVYVREVKGRKYPPPAQPYVMDQVGLEFEPALLPILVGGKVSFPNKDDVHHELYSFSSAKKFELPLYKGKPAEPIVFDKVGVVKLGCNIHDWMSGVILVLQNPIFARTDKDGKATLKGVPEKTPVELVVYHPRLRGEPEKTAEKPEWSGSHAASLSWQIELKPDTKKKRPDNSYGGSNGQEP